MDQKRSKRKVSKISSRISIFSYEEHEVRWVAFLGIYEVPKSIEEARTNRLRIAGTGFCIEGYTGERIEEWRCT